MQDDLVVQKHEQQKQQKVFEKDQASIKYRLCFLNSQIFA